MSTGHDAAVLRMRFKRAWKLLSARGLVGKWGECQCKHVRQLWTAAKKPHGVTRFIYDHRMDQPSEDDRPALKLFSSSGDQEAE